MGSDRPDFHPTMLLEGRFGTSLIPILTDALGQLYTVMSGIFGGVPTPILLDAAGRILAHLVGNDGSTIRDVKVDSAGNLVARIQGNDGTTQRDVKVDASGFLQAIMQGSYGTTLKTIAVDANGIMKANLTAQDLNYLSFRPVYGNHRQADFDVSIPNATFDDVVNISGRGSVLFGNVHFEAGVAPDRASYYLSVDGTDFIVQTPSFLEELGIRERSFLYSRSYNTVIDDYVVGIEGPINFETSFQLLAAHSAGGNKTCGGTLYYALVP
jgi:hypothetical protein